MDFRNRLKIELGNVIKVPLSGYARSAPSLLEDEVRRFGWLVYIHSTHDPDDVVTVEGTLHIR